MQLLAGGLVLMQMVKHQFVFVHRNSFSYVILDSQIRNYKTSRSQEVRAPLYTLVHNRDRLKIGGHKNIGDFQFCLKTFQNVL